MLKNNGNDLNKAYEELQLRLERKKRTLFSTALVFSQYLHLLGFCFKGSSWESVDKSKKKKAEKQVIVHGIQCFWFLSV